MVRGRVIIRIKDETSFRGSIQGPFSISSTAVLDKDKFITSAMYVEQGYLYRNYIPWYTPWLSTSSNQRPDQMYQNEIINKWSIETLLLNIGEAGNPPPCLLHCCILL